MIDKPVTNPRQRLYPGVLSGVLYGCVALIFILSFRAQAAFLTPQFNSDSAIHVLMAADLQLPKDLYYWGQDRLGSAVPIVGHVLLRIFPIRPVEAVSIAQYFFLLVGYCCFASLLHKLRSKLIFALIWFLPLPCFYEFLSIGQPYGPQFACLGIAFVLLNRVYSFTSGVAEFKYEVCFERRAMPASQNKLHRTNLQSPSSFSAANLRNDALDQSPVQNYKGQTLAQGWRRRMILSGAIAFLCLSQWISDFTVVPLFLLGCMALYFIGRGLRQPSDMRLKIVAQIKSDGLNIGAIYLLGFLAIQVAKRIAGRSPKAYSSFVNGTEFQAVIRKLGRGLGETLTFQMDSWALSLHAIMAIALISFLLWHALQRWIRALSQRHQAFQQQVKHPDNAWVWIALGSAVLGLVLLMTSRHVYQNKVNLRYFTSSYVFGWLAILLYSEQLKYSEQLNRRLARKVGILLLVMAIASSAALPWRYYSWERTIGKIEQLQPLQALGQSSFIGEYWSSYVLCSVNPRQMSCTSHDRANRPSQEVCTVGRDLSGGTSRERPFQRRKTVRCPRCVERVFQSDQIYLVQSKKWLSDGFPEQINQFNRCLKKTGEPFTLAGYTMAAYRQE